MLPLLYATLIALALFLLWCRLYPLERNRLIEDVFARFDFRGARREFVRVERRTAGRPRYYLPVAELKLSREEKLKRMEARFAAARKGKGTV
jgi:hypothetical protein